MKKLIIDPPVNEFSPPSKVEAWIAQLGDMRDRYRGDADIQAEIDEAEEAAREMLVTSREVHS